MERRNFHSGLNITPAILNGLEDYTDKRMEGFASLGGWGLISGFGATMEGGFALGIGPGLAYDASGRRLSLEAGKQINLADLAPAIGLKTVKVGAVFAYAKGEPLIDLDGNTVLTKWVETADFAKGADGLPAEALALYEVQLSSSAITLITPVFRPLETLAAASARTRGFTNTGGALSLEGSSAKFTRPDGFTLDLIEGCLRKTVFDPLHGPYKKGDILWLEPLTYDTQSTPPEGSGYPYTVPSEKAFMGKARTYSKPTDYRQQAVRLRALKDNPRNPNIAGAIGTDWAADEPAAIIEEGSNTNGSYKIFANGYKQQKPVITNTMNTAVNANVVSPSLPYPIWFEGEPSVIYPGGWYTVTVHVVAPLVGNTNTHYKWYARSLLNIVEPVTARFIFEGV